MGTVTGFMIAGLTVEKFMNRRRTNYVADKTLLPKRERQNKKGKIQTV